MAQGKPVLPSVKLSDEDRMAFARAVFEARKKSNNQISWSDAIDVGRKALPKGKHIGATINNPRHITWLQPLLDKLAKEEKQRVAIDQRDKKQKAEAVSEEKKRVGGEGPRIHLNSEERSIFAEAVYTLRKTRPELTWNMVFKEANNVLPPHRHVGSTYNTVSNLKWLAKMLEEIDAKEKAAEKAAQAEPASPAPAPEAPPAPPAPPAFDFEGMLVQALAGVVKQALPQIAQSEKFQNALAGSLMGAPAQPVKPATPAEPPKKKKVVVVGLLPIQTNEVQREFGSKFDFRFVGANTPSQQIRESAKNCDYAFLMTQFVSHSTQAAIRQHAGFHFCNGNSTALKNLLQEKVNAFH